MLASKLTRIQYYCDTVRLVSSGSDRTSGSGKVFLYPHMSSLKAERGRDHFRSK